MGLYGYLAKLARYRLVGDSFGNLFCRQIWRQMTPSIAKFGDIGDIWRLLVSAVGNDFSTLHDKKPPNFFSNGRIDDINSFKPCQKIKLHFAKNRM